MDASPVSVSESDETLRDPWLCTLRMVGIVATEIPDVERGAGLGRRIGMSRGVPWGGEDVR
jgi:hypothetical protein